MTKSGLNIVLVFFSFVLFIAVSPSKFDYKTPIETQEEISKKFLKEDSMVQGFPCTGWVHLFPEGTLRQFELSHDFVITGVIFPRNTIVFLDDKQKLEKAYLSKDTEIHSYPCPGGKGKLATGFYASGKLRYFFPRNDMLVNGYPVAGGSMKGVWFYESGKLKKFFLTKDYMVNGVQYSKGDEVNI